MYQWQESNISMAVGKSHWQQYYKHHLQLYIILATAHHNDYPINCHAAAVSVACVAPTASVAGKRLWWHHRESSVRIRSILSGGKNDHAAASPSRPVCSKALGNKQVRTSRGAQPPHHPITCWCKSPIGHPGIWRL